MRRFNLTALFVCALLLLLAQQGATLHELSHAYYTAQQSGAQVGSDQQLPDNEHCPVCRSFAQVGSSVCGSSHALELPVASGLRVPERVYSIIGAKAPTARSRGPPETSV